MEKLFAREQLTMEFWKELLPLTLAHWNTVNLYKEFPFQLNAIWFMEQQAAGCFRVFTIRREGKLVGYELFVVGPHLHSPSCLQATPFGLYVEPSARGWSTIRFLKWVDEQLEGEGLSLIRRHTMAKDELNTGRLLERMGYELTDQIYTRRVK